MKQITIEERLELVFKTVFDGLPESKELWNILDIKEWDSLTHVRLMTAIETEFSITIMPALYLQCTSYKKIRDVLGE